MKTVVLWLLFTFTSLNQFLSTAFLAARYHHVVVRTPTTQQLPLFRTFWERRTSPDPLMSTPQAGDKDADVPPSRRVRLWKALKSVTTSPAVPLLFAFGFGYRFGKQAVTSTITTGTKAAVSKVGEAGTTMITSQKRPPYLLITVLVAVGLREIWRGIPDWLKRQLPIVGRRQRRLVANAKASEVDTIDPSDMTSVAAIASKLQALFTVASGKLAEPLKMTNVQIAFFALLQLMAQIKNRYAEYRDNRYIEAGEIVENPLKELEGLDEIFEFADWAYDELPDEKPLRDALQELNFSLLRHDKVALPGCVAHYIAISKERKLALFGIKGTSSFEDMLTDCCGQAVTHELDAPYVAGGNSEIRCHEGIFLATKKLAADVETFVEELLIPNDYKLLITGHSLGAGVAALLGLLLRSRFPSLKSDNGSRLRVVAFASPPILDYDSALACSSFVTTVVNNSDVIPRSSLSNLMVLLEFLKVINKRLEERGVEPTGFASIAGYLKLLMEGGGEDLMTAGEFMDELDAAYEKVELRDPDHLYVPGRVLHMYDLWSKENYGETADDIQEHAADAAEGKIETIAPETKTAEKVNIADGASKPLRSIEIDSRMMSDHLSPAYRSSFRSLLQTHSQTASKLSVKEAS